MRRWRIRVVYFVLLPVIALAAGVLGYYSWLTAAQFDELGEEAIAGSTLLLVREKVDIIEQFVIGADNRVMRLVDFSEPEAIAQSWRPAATEMSPSVRAVVVLDDEAQIIAYSARANAQDAAAFRTLFEGRILPDLELAGLRLWRLKHLHQDYGERNYLISYKALHYRGRRFYIALHHDSGYLVREQFPELFATEEAEDRYNVVNHHGRRVFGPSLAQAGDYLVGHRFPTTLYNWRLQVALHEAAALEEQGRSRRLTDLGLIGTSFAVILLGVIFLLYAAGQERRLNALKSEFIANVSHELKTPLSVVRMFGELLLTKRVRSNEKQQQYLEIICLESERLSALIENVLDFSALERGKQKYELVPGDMRDAVARAIDTFRYRMEREGTNVSYSPDEVPGVQFDEQAIVLAVVNLLDNAVKYGERSEVEVKVEHVGEAVRLTVRDHGPGIPSEDLRKIFDRFYRSRRKKQQTRGSGIGLSLVKHIAEGHGGTVFAENADDGGAAVGFSLPAA